MKIAISPILILSLCLAACGGSGKGGPEPFVVKSVAGHWDVYRTYTGKPELGPDLTEWSNSGTGYGIKMHAICSSYVLPGGTVDIAGEIHDNNLYLDSGNASWQGMLAENLGHMSGTFSDTRGTGTWRAVKTSNHSCVTYEVYGGNAALPCGGIEGYNPEEHSYTLLGSAAATATFTGTYNYYIFVTRDYNVIRLDTVQDGGSVYYGTQSTGNTTGADNVGGVPDGKCATVGDSRMSGGGYVYIDATQSPPASITAIIYQ